jgi:hypothetical protein
LPVRVSGDIFALPEEAFETPFPTTYFSQHHLLLCLHSTTLVCPPPHQLDRAIGMEVYADTRALGRFMLRREGETIAVGVVTKILA